MPSTMLTPTDYSGYVLDPDGNNVEAVNLPPRKST